MSELELSNTPEQVHHAFARGIVHGRRAERARILSILRQMTDRSWLFLAPARRILAQLEHMIAKED